MIREQLIRCRHVSVDQRRLGIFHPRIPGRNPSSDRWPCQSPWQPLPHRFISRIVVFSCLISDFLRRPTVALSGAPHGIISGFFPSASVVAVSALRLIFTGRFSSTILLKDSFGRFFWKILLEDSFGRFFWKKRSAGPAHRGNSVRRGAGEPGSRLPWKRAPRRPRPTGRRLKRKKGRLGCDFRVGHQLICIHAHYQPARGNPSQRLIRGQSMLINLLSSTRKHVDP